MSQTMTSQVTDDNGHVVIHPVQHEQGIEQPVRWSIPLALFACVLLAFFDKVSIAALFSDSGFQQAMGIGFDATRLGWLMSAFLLSYGCSSILLSSIGDHFNPKNLLIIMMFSWGMLMVMMGFSRSYLSMIVWRILLGIAEGPLFALAFAIVRHAFPKRLQARATMLWLLGTPIGAAVGIPATLFLLKHYSWESTFFVMAALTLPTILLVFIGLREVNIEPRLAAPETKNTLRPAVVPREWKEEWKALLSSTHFWLVCIFNIAFLTYLWGINSWLPSYLIEGKSIDLKTMGYLTSLPFIAMLLGEVLGAWLSDYFERRALACFISICGAGLGLVAVLYATTPFTVIAVMAFSTFMWGAGAPNIFALLGKVVEKQASAKAGGIFNGLGNFAGALAPAVMGILITATHSMDSGIRFLIAMALIGSLILLPLLSRY